MKKLRVIQIGTAHDHAADATLTLKELNNDFELLGVVEENPLFLQKAKKNPDYDNLPFISYDDALKLKPDAFLIETEEKLLVPTAKKVLSAGFNVYMDKPGSEDKQSFREICELAKSKKLVLFLAYMYRYNPAVMYAKNVITATTRLWRRIIRKITCLTVRIIPLHLQRVIRVFPLRLLRLPLLAPLLYYCLVKEKAQ